MLHGADEPAYLMARIVFLGSGASGGTPGSGRSLRRESSLLVSHAGHRMLIDATRDFDEQAEDLDRVDAVLITHAHRDASGGLRALGRWLDERGGGPVPIHAHPDAISTFRSRWSALRGLTPREVTAGEELEVGPWHVQAIEVPHAQDTPTFAWRLDGPASLVYASDVAEPSTGLRQASAGAEVLVVDGAMWRRQLYSHLRVDEDLPEICSWDVGRVLLTQIGRTAPDHDEFAEAVRDLCDRAEPAYDGLVVEL